MDIISKIAIWVLPVLVTIIGFLLAQKFSQINDSISEVKIDVKDFRENVSTEISNLRIDIGTAINNTGILSEEIISIEKQCNIRHKE
jgi:hypothetical protein